MNGEEDLENGSEIETTQTLCEMISHAETTLDRIIVFINNSEGKTGITLTMIGVILTILFTLSGENIMEMLSVAWNDSGFIASAFLILFPISLAFTLFGLYNLIRVLVPTLDSKKYQDHLFEKDSKIYFGGITSNNETYSGFRKKLSDYSNEDYLNDLWSQIYINSKIATKKFNYFKKGVIVVIPSLLTLLMIVVVFGFLILG